MKKFLSLLIVLAILIAGYFVSDVYAPLSTNAKSVSFTVAKGEGVKGISDDLQSQGLIRNSTVFYYYARFKGDSHPIIAGEYSLSASMSPAQIFGALTGGKVEDTDLTIRVVEGATLDDVAADWAAAHPDNPEAAADFQEAAQDAAQQYGFFGEQPKVRSLEGYLFPDTYFVANDAGPSELIQKMLDNLNEKLTPDLRAQIAAQHKSIYDILTMASIVEKEVGRDQATLSQQDLDNLAAERKTVAGIFYNRLAQGIPLQSDATITYLTKKKDPSATDADLQINSPYNTYMYKGLPPGPISNPSLSSIEAAIDPTQTTYLYFLTKPDGTAVFAKTLQEQDANKAKYLQ